MLKYLIVECPVFTLPARESMLPSEPRETSNKSGLNFEMSSVLVL